jgi:hypothetical protein
MIERLSDRDKRALKVGITVIAAIVLFIFMATWFEHWASVRKLLVEVKSQLKTADLSKAKQQGLMSIVPVFEMPEKEERQKNLFREKFNKQLKKAGISGEPLQVLPVTKSPVSGYKLLRLKCKGSGKFGQILDLLAELKNSPYLAGIDEMRINCKEKNRQQVTFDLTVTTFVR